MFGNCIESLNFGLLEVRFYNKSYKAMKVEMV